MQPALIWFCMQRMHMSAVDRNLPESRVKSAPVSGQLQAFMAWRRCEPTHAKNLEALEPNSAV